MKKYFVRSIGWVFDDDWYNYDGEHDLEGVYDTKQEAEKRVDYLNHRYFLVKLIFRSPYQLKYNYEENGEDFVDRKLLAVLIAEKVGVEKTQIFDIKKGFIWKNEVDFLKYLSEVQVKEILKSIRLTFFRVFEFNSEKEMVLYQFKRNPDLWRRYYKDDAYFDSDDAFYFFDDRDSDNKRLVETKKACYYYAINANYESIKWGLVNEELISGSLKELSETPDLLSQIIKNSITIDYDIERELIIFTEDVLFEEIMVLDTVLIKPILIIEKVHIDRIIPMKSKYHNYVLEEVKRNYNI